jgi:ABC-2 type transport system permease protein
MISMVMALLGGAWFPQELFPNGIRQVMAWLPTSQAMNAMKGILIQGKGLADVWPNALVLFAYAVIFFAIGIPLFRRANRL